MDNEISTVSARLDDRAAMEKFLLPIPNSEQLIKVLESRKIISTRAYDDEARTARFVTSDGNIAVCFTVTDLTIDQAEMIASACEDTPGWNSQEFQEIVDQVLGAA